MQGHTGQLVSCPPVHKADSGRRFAAPVVLLQRKRIFRCNSGIDLDLVIQIIARKTAPARADRAANVGIVFFLRGADIVFQCTEQQDASRCAEIAGFNDSVAQCAVAVIRAGKSGGAVADRAFPDRKTLRRLPACRLLADAAPRSAAVHDNALQRKTRGRRIHRDDITVLRFRRSCKDSRIIRIGAAEDDILAVEVQIHGIRSALEQHDDRLRRDRQAVKHPLQCLRRGGHRIAHIGRSNGEGITDGYLGRCLRHIAAEGVVQARPVQFNDGVYIAFARLSARCQRNAEALSVRVCISVSGKHRVGRIRLCDFAVDAQNLLIGSVKLDIFHELARKTVFRTEIVGRIKRPIGDVLAGIDIHFKTAVLGKACRVQRRNASRAEACQVFRQRKRLIVRAAVEIHAVGIIGCAFLEQIEGIQNTAHRVSRAQLHCRCSGDLVGIEVNAHTRESLGPQNGNVLRRVPCDNGRLRQHKVAAV